MDKKQQTENPDTGESVKKVSKTVWIDLYSDGSCNLKTRILGGSCMYDSLNDLIEDLTSEIHQMEKEL